MNEQKNLILAVVLSAIVLIGWQLLVPRKQPPAPPPAQEQQQPGTAQQQTGSQQSLEPSAGGPEMQSTQKQSVPGASGELTHSEALARSKRVRIETPKLAGSISLTGARFDDIVLKDYRETVSPESPQIELLKPEGSPGAYFAKFGWSKQKGVAVPQHDTVWTASSDVLTPDRPVTLRWDNGQGLIFEQEISVDRNYMFSVAQRVRNETGSPVELQPYALVRRIGTPKTLGYYILHEGPLGVFGDSLTEKKYSALEEEPFKAEATAGWLGFTDKYWLSAVIPKQGEKFDSSFKMQDLDGVKVYQTDYVASSTKVEPGATGEYDARLFAGAKVLKLLDSYSENDNVPNFDLAVDFGWYYFLTKPMFITLDVLYGWWGNFGLAILTLTLIIKALLFPIANKSYKSMSKMKLLAPKMQELKERYGDDRMRLNQEMMDLYKREKVNPAAGCLPIIPQMIIFFSLYKVLFISIEMRHAPFFGWIVDLSSPDPLGVLTLFGLVPWDVPQSLHILNIGILPILMGVSMYFLQRMNPPPPDPVQAKIMRFLPVIFTFFLARFPAGLVIYWTWNNLLSIAQQWTIMKQMQNQLQQQKNT